MGLEVGGGSQESEGIKLEKEEISALIVKDVKILKSTFVVDVPKYKDVDQIRYNTKEEDTIRYNVKEEGTIKYNKIEKDTIEFVKKEEETIKYIPKEVVREKPVVIEKEYVVATIKDMEKVKELIEAMPVLSIIMAELKEELDKLRRYKLVEQEVKVEKVKFIPTETERIVWVDVEKERCASCGKGV